MLLRARLLVLLLGRLLLRLQRLASPVPDEPAPGSRRAARPRAAAPPGIRPSPRPLPHAGRLSPARRPVPAKAPPLPLTGRFEAVTGRGPAHLPC
ncbi:hypothetical protein GCM10009605_24180 [Nocardiopsis composta]